MEDEIRETICVNVAKHYTTEEALTDWLKGGGLIPRSLNFIACVEVTYPADMADEPEDTVNLNFWSGVTAWDYNRGWEDCYGDCPSELDTGEDYRLNEIKEKREELEEKVRSSLWTTFSEFEEMCEAPEKWDEEEVCKAFKEILELDDDKKAELINKVAEVLVNEVIEYVKEHILVAQV